LKKLPFPRGIAWRPAVGYLLLLLVFYALIELFGDKTISLTQALFIATPVAGWLVWIFIKRFTRPLYEIIEASREITRGNLDRRLRIHSGDEIGQLAQNINDLAGQLKNSISQVTEARNQFEAILKSMADGVIAVNQNGEVLFINPVVEEIFGTGGESAKGKNVLGVLRHYDAERFVQRVLKTGEPATLEIKAIGPQEKVFRLHATPLQSAQTGRGGAVILLRDITERKKLEEMRTEFVANVSHELRTPLTSLQGYLETLLGGAIDEPETARRFLEIMSKETERLTRLVDDLLHLSKIEGRRIAHRWQPVRLAECIDRVLAMFRPQARAKNITLNGEVQPDLPYVQGDPDMLTQVLINLVDNAVKYTPAGGKVTVAAQTQGENVRVAVADTGPGIPPESLPRIFERFYRVDKARSRELGGIGVGLAIVKHIVNAHGGKTFVESTVGKGSTFSFVLPAAAEPEDRKEDR
jgi:two-component system phosphate regulon sensor histidine kinase PhoR